MKALLRLIGRILFVTVLLTSAVIKIKQPTNYVSQFTNGYNTIRNLHGSISSILPTTNIINSTLPLPTIIRIIGAIQALIGLLIFFGDALGGCLLFGYLTIYGISAYSTSIINSLIKAKPQELLPLLPQFTFYLIFLGFSIVFMNKRVSKKAPIKV